MRSLRVLRNVITNYARFFVSGLIGFLLTPVMVHILGDGQYGLWVAVFSLTGYFGLVDQGIRPSLVRYVSRAQASGDRDDLARTLSSAVALYTAAGTLVIIATLIAAARFGDWFHIDPSQIAAARTTILIAGASLALGFPFGVYGAALSGFQRYDIANGIGIGIGILRALLFLLVLRLGGGIVELAWVSLGTTLLGHFLSWLAVQRIAPGISIHPRHVDGAHLRRVGSYSGFAFVGALASLVAFQTDSLIITAFLGTALVTPFALAAGLIDNVRSLVHSATWVLSPTASEMETLGETGKLQAMLIAGAKYSVLLSWPVLMGLIVFGRDLLVTWIGPAYSSSAPLLDVLRPGGPQATASHLLVLLAIPTFLALPQSAASSVLFGISRHKGVVGLSILNAAIGLGLSVTLVRPLGLAGIALGTAIPLALVSGVATAFYAAHALRMSAARYFWEGMGRPGLATLAFLVPAIAAERLFHPVGWMPLLLATSIPWLIFVAVASRVAVGSEERARWGRTLSGVFGIRPRAAAAAPETL